MNSQQIETYRQRLVALANRHENDLKLVAGEVHGVGGEPAGNLSNVPSPYRTSSSGNRMASAGP